MSLKTGCRCAAAGYCDYLKRDMSPFRWKQCREESGYFEVFEAQMLKMSSQKKGGESVAGSSGRLKGCGSHLKDMLSGLGVYKTSSCNCNKYARIMDQMGPQWCRENIDTILGWLNSEAKKRGIPFLRPAAKRLVMIAIKRTEREQNDG